MKRNTLTIVVGVLLLIIFALMIFTFQVRQTEIAVVTTFNKLPEQPIREPGLYWKWPRPIQKVYKFDNRIHNFEDKLEQTLTRDNYPLLARLYVGWKITDPAAFFNRFESGTASEAEPALEGLIRSTKNEVIGKHSFSDFVTTNPAELKFIDVEKEILQALQPLAKERLGVEIQFVGLKQLSLPESVTEKVFARMEAERDSKAQSLKSEGEAAARIIRSEADRDRDQLLAEAQSRATAIRAQADAESAKQLQVLDSDPELAILIYKLRALEQVLKERATLIFDPRTWPFDLLVTPPKELVPKSPAAAGSAKVGMASPQTPVLSGNPTKKD